MQNTFVDFISPQIKLCQLLFSFFAQPKHFAFLAPSIKLTLVVTTLQRWLIYWKKPLPLPLPCPLLFVDNASVICCHCHCYLLFQIHWWQRDYTKVYLERSNNTQQSLCSKQFWIKSKININLMWCSLEIHLKSPLSLELSATSRTQSSIWGKKKNWHICEI